VLDFYAEFRAHRATCLKVDGKDIIGLKLIFTGESDAENETSTQRRVGSTRMSLVDRAFAGHIIETLFHNNKLSILISA
jgi:hypothetical protein